MTYDEAIAEAYTGARVRHDRMQPGQYVEHVFSRGLLKCWPVDCPSEEPNRTQCDFRPDAADLAADWHELPAPVRAPVTQPPGNPVPVREQAARAGWGAPIAAPAPAPAKSSAWGTLGTTPKPKAEPVEFCAECDYAKSACVCPKDAPEPPKPATSGWGTAIKPQEKSKWG